MDAAADPREWFEHASAAAVHVVASVPDDAWELAGLGEWSVRELVAHTLRAWSTVRDYLGEPVPPEDSPVITAAQYLAGGLTMPGIHEGVAERGRAEVVRLGSRPAVTVRALARETSAVVAACTDERLLPTRIGVMHLGEYLRTRAFELTVHGIDITRAAGLEAPPALVACTVPALGLAAEVAGERGLAARLLAAAVGREELGPDFTLMS